MRRLVFLLALALLLSPPSRAAELTVVGAWTINRDLSDMLPDSEARRAPESRRPAGSGRRGGGIGGGGGGIGRGGLPGLGGGSDKKEDEQHKVEVIRRRLTETPDRLIITTAANQVTITDGLGRSYTLKADGKKQERVTGDGEFTTKTRFTGAALIVEDDFGGPTLTTTYTPMLDGGEIRRLIVTLKPDRLPGAARQRLERRTGGNGGGETREIKHVYDADAK